MVIWHLRIENTELEPKFQKYKRVVVPKRCLWCIRDVHRTRTVSISNDSNKGNWCHCKTTLWPSINRRWLHWSSSHWTPCSPPHAEWRIIPKSTKVFWRDEDNSHRSGCDAREAYQRFLERRLDRTLSDSWTSVTKLTFLHEKHHPGFLWSGERLTKFQATTRLDSLWSEIFIGTSNAAKRAKQEWAMEKAKGWERSKTERHVFWRSGRCRV